MVFFHWLHAALCWMSHKPKEFRISNINNAFTYSCLISVGHISGFISELFLCSSRSSAGAFLSSDEELSPPASPSRLFSYSQQLSAHPPPLCHLGPAHYWNPCSGIQVKKWCFATMLGYVSSTWQDNIIQISVFVTHSCPCVSSRL